MTLTVYTKVQFKSNITDKFAYEKLITSANTLKKINNKRITNFQY